MRDSHNAELMPAGGELAVQQMLIALVGKITDVEDNHSLSSKCKKYAITRYSMQCVL